MHNPQGTLTSRQGYRVDSCAQVLNFSVEIHLVSRTERHIKLRLRALLIAHLEERPPVYSEDFYDLDNLPPILRYQGPLSQEKIAHINRVNTRISGTPPMTFCDDQRKAQWTTAMHEVVGDDYKLGILMYTQRWARLMELELSEGKTLAEIWRTLSDEADLEGMSGAAITMATSLLIAVWIHGEELGQLYYRWRESTPATFPGLKNNGA